MGSCCLDLFALPGLAFISLARLGKFLPVISSNKFSFFLFLFLFKYSCLHFYPTMAPALPIPISHPGTYPRWLCQCVLYTCSLMDLPPLSPIILLPPPLWLLFVLISMFLVIFCLLVCFVSNKFSISCCVFWYHCDGNVGMLDIVLEVP